MKKGQKFIRWGEERKRLEVGHKKLYLKRFLFHSYTFHLLALHLSPSPGYKTHSVSLTLYTPTLATAGLPSGLCAGEMSTEEIGRAINKKLAVVFHPQGFLRSKAGVISIWPKDKYAELSEPQMKSTWPQTIIPPNICQQLQDAPLVTAISSVETTRPLLVTLRQVFTILNRMGFCFFYFVLDLDQNASSCLLCSTRST